MHQLSALHHHSPCFKQRTSGLSQYSCSTKRLGAKSDQGGQQQDKAALVLLKTTHWMAQEGVPLSKFDSLHNLLTEVGVPDLIPLQQKAVSYSSRYTATEMLSSIADTVHAALKKKVNASPFVTVLTDESTDITNHKRLVVYVQITDTETFQPSTHFVANKECLDTTGAGIAKCIQEVMSELDVPSK